MIHHSTIIALTLLLTSCLPAETTTQPATKPGKKHKAPVSLIIDMEDRQPADAPVILKVKITNTSNKDLTRHFEQNTQFRAYLTGPDGQPRKVAITNGSRIRGSFQCSTPLKPGQSAVTPLRLTNYPVLDWRDYLPYVGYDPKKDKHTPTARLWD